MGPLGHKWPSSHIFTYLPISVYFNKCIYIYLLLISQHSFLKTSWVFINWCIYLFLYLSISLLSINIYFFIIPVFLCLSSSIYSYIYLYNSIYPYMFLSSSIPVILFVCLSMYLSFWLTISLLIGFYPCTHLCLCHSLLCFCINVSIDYLSTCHSLCLSINVTIPIYIFYLPTYICIMYIYLLINMSIGGFLKYLMISSYISCGLL